MSSFLESPLPILFLGLSAQIVLVVLLVATRRGAILYAMGGVLLVVGAVLLVGHLVVTDQKRVQATLENARAAVESNDLKRLLGCIAPSAKAARQVAEHGLRSATFSEARIRGLKIAFDRQPDPPVAKAQLTAFVAFQLRTTDVPFDRYLSELVVELRPTDGRWLITDINERQGVIQELRK